ncbi:MULTISPECIES: hypothetical protein [unclassified Aminobacter]|uniref:hypothetical protein n=1 Tax=unclassified Aminobacter TaxID=2644704 RepID=UPI0004642CA2|nr:MULTISPECIES: hypothetical protein [unclassified Aminobacter]TWG61089.1 hypothetical protein L610_002400000380 [Aminobacter sp. J44]TWH31696.1 hypothetical protein L611_002400000310 [Aminobacter sp. J15]
MARIPPLSIVICAAALLSACTSSKDVLEPSALLGTGGGSAESPAQFPINDQTQQQAAPQTAAVASNARIQIEPIIGATEAASRPLASRLSSQASTRGLKLVSDSSATHILKGYFSAITENGETTVIYVWDVVDPSGTRVHRIQGKSKNVAQGGEGWASVQVPTMEAIADQTLDELAAWLAARPS